MLYSWAGLSTRNGHLLQRQTGPKYFPANKLLATYLCFVQIMFGVFLGACYGGFCRLLNNLGRRFKLVERQSFLAHVIGMALGVVGATTLVGEDGVLRLG